jgi:hypothetical protein
LFLAIAISPEHLREQVLAESFRVAVTLKVAPQTSQTLKYLGLSAFTFTGFATLVLKHSQEQYNILLFADLRFLNSLPQHLHTAAWNASAVWQDWLQCFAVSALS